MRISKKSGFDARGVIFCAFFTIAAMGFAGTYSGGSGSTDNPYQLANAADLIALSESPNDWYSNFILTADIDMDPNLSGGKVFDRALIAPDTSTTGGFQGQSFSGSLNGNGFAIRNLTIRCGDGASYIGLFGYVGCYDCGNRRGVWNLRLVDSSIDVGGGATKVGLLAGGASMQILDCHASGIIHAGPETTNLGGLLGWSYRIDNCSVEGSIWIESGSQVGGLVGSGTGGIIHCSAEIQLIGEGDLVDVGGLVGVAFESYVDHCQSIGLITISGRAVNVGGLVGRNHIEVRDDGEGGYLFPFPVEIAQSSSAGLISTGIGSVAVGGLVGYNSTASGGCTYGNWIESCASTRTVIVGDGSSFIGGFVGRHDLANAPDRYWPSIGYIVACYAAGPVMTSGICENAGGFVGGGGGRVGGCYWDVEVSGQTGNGGGTGKTTAEMMTKATYVGWDFTGEIEDGPVWRMCEDGIDYPRLEWEFLQGRDMVCPDGVGIEDLVYLAGRWMASTPETVGAADGNGDGKVDMVDLAIVSENWMN